MASRRRSRHRAVQLLFECDVRGVSLEDAIDDYYETLYSEENAVKPPRDRFMEELARGVLSKLEQIDSLLQARSENWRVERMSAVDRNIMRLGVYELLDAKVAPAVIIDEALELSRKFAGDQSVGFVNGVLDAVAKSIERESREKNL
jgi:N utilization substance protein B